MSGDNPNAKKLRENDRKNKGPRSIASDPEAFSQPEPKSKLHHSKGKRNGKK